MDQLPSYSPPPGAPGVEPARMERFAHALRMRGEGYRPRTRHIGPDGWAKYTNRLFLRRALTFSSMRTTRSTGIPGATRRSNRPGGSAVPCS